MAKIKLQPAAKAKGGGKGKAPAKGKGPAKVSELLKQKPKFKTMPTVAAGPAVKAEPAVKVAPPAAPVKAGKGTGKGKGGKVIPMAIPANVLPIGDAAATPADVANRMDEMAADVLKAQARDAAGLPFVAPSDWVAPHPVGATVRVPIESVDMDPKNNGRALDPAKVKEYAADYAKRIAAGTEPQLQECTGFYPVGENKLRLVFGFHRAAAVKALNEKNAKLSTWATAPMQLRVRIVDDMSIYNALLDNWAENKHHNALTPVAEMRYMVRLRDDHKLEQKAIAKTLGVSATLVSLRLLLERLDPGTLKLVEDGTIPVKSAYMLAGIEDPTQRATALVKVAAVFEGLADAGTVKGLKLPKTQIVAQAVAEATGQAGTAQAPGAAAGAGVDGDNPPAPAPNPDPAPKRLAVGKIETTLVNVVKSEAAPAEVRTVLRAVLGWVLGQRTPAAMVNTVAKALGYNPKTFDAAAVVAGEGPVVPTSNLLDGVPAVQVQGAGDMAPAPAAE